MVSGEMTTGVVPSGILRGVYFCCLSVNTPSDMAGDVPDVCMTVESRLRTHDCEVRFTEIYNINTSTHLGGSSIVAASVVFGEISSICRSGSKGWIFG
jgi:hypothetical protein